MEVQMCKECVCMWGQNVFYLCICYKFPKVIRPVITELWITSDLTDSAEKTSVHVAMVSP